MRGVHTLAEYVEKSGSFDGTTLVREMIENCTAIIMERRRIPKGNTVKNGVKQRKVKLFSVQKTD